MPKLTRQRANPIQVEQPKKNYAIRAVQAQLSKGGVIYQPIREFSLGKEVSLVGYITEANDLQREFDEDCDPVRVYVLEDGIPICAALDSKASLMKITGWSDTHTTRRLAA